MNGNNFVLPPIQWRKATRILDFKEQSGFATNQTGGYVVKADVEPPALGDYEPLKGCNVKPPNGVATPAKPKALAIDQRCFQVEDMLTTKEKQAILNSYVPITETSPSKWLARKVALLCSPDAKKSFNSTFERDAFYFDEETEMIVPNHCRVAEAASQFNHILEAAEEAFLMSRKTLTELKSATRKARSSMRSLHKCRRHLQTDRVVNNIYKYYYTRANQHAANGGSTYASLTETSMESIITKMVELECVPSSGVVADLGSGLAMPALHMAQRMPSCCFVCIENNVERCFSFAFWFHNLMQKEDMPLRNYKIACIYDDIFKYTDYEFCDVVYTFDEAFPPDLMEHIIKTFSASSRPKWLISFKTGRRGDHDIKKLFEEYGLEVVDSVRCKKAGSGEVSNAQFYRRQFNSGKLPAKEHNLVAKIEPFWSGDQGIIRTAVENLCTSFREMMPSNTRTKIKN